MKTGLEKFVNWLNGFDCICNEKQCIFIVPFRDFNNKKKELLAEEKKEKSLAELANEKGFRYEVSPPNKKEDTFMWSLSLYENSKLYRSFCVKTYAEVEQKAKDYLRGIK